MALEQTEDVATSSPRTNAAQIIGFGTILAVACLVSYWLITYILAREHSVSRDNDLLGGMWAVIATIFVFRQSVRHSARAGLTRAVATLLSFALCFIYFLIFPFSVFGMIALIWVSTIILAFLGRYDDIVTTAITTSVIFVVVALSPGPAWMQPVLRLVDTAVGIAIGMLASLLTLAFVRLNEPHFNRQLN